MTTADTAAQRPDAAHKGLLARHPLIFFFLLLSFVFTWGYLVLYWALQLPGPIYALATAGPPISAFLILAVTLAG